MSIAAAPMTAEEFFALPDRDNVEQWLIDGRLKEFRMSIRGPAHARVATKVTVALDLWAGTQPHPRPGVYVGDIYFLLKRNPDRSVGIDVAVAAGDVVAALPGDAKFIEGTPLLAVEVLSPSDRAARVERKIDLYLTSGTPAVWLVNPFRKTVTVHKPTVEPVLFTGSMRIAGDPELPGFSVAVADLFP